ncbi:Protein unc-13 4B like [Melia azedarach]|uniref:Protein unc-13 4B like n=1 Tax=Melia azedarach TaxID=155640 RepID=A0ACC1YBM4_MELAZ|nr:Protein unc-13 4B like [Melia azedarach]
MVAEHYFNHLEPVLQQEGTSSTDHLQDNFDEAAEETLSLCDLAVNSNSEDYLNDNDFSEEQCRQSTSDEQDFFEFFSEDFTAASTYPRDDIIFCGKLIPYREPAAVPEQTQNTNTQKNIKKSRIFPWKSNSFNKYSRSTSSKAQRHEKSTYSYKSLSQKVNGYETFNYEYDFSEKKVSSSTVAAASVRPRWYLFAFGYGRTFSTEMELKDMKSRQNRRIPATMFRSLEGGGDEMIKRSETHKRSSSWKGLWTLLKVLGCKSRQANAVAKASFGCIRHV